MRIASRPTVILLGVLCFGGIVAMAPVALAAQPSATITGTGQGKASLKAILKKLGVNPAQARAPAIAVRASSSTSRMASPFDEAAHDVHWRATKHWPASDQDQVDPEGQPQPHDQIQLSWEEGCYTYKESQEYLRTPEHGYLWVNVSRSVDLRGSKWQSPPSFSCTSQKDAQKVQSH